MYIYVYIYISVYIIPQRPGRRAPPTSRRQAAAQHARPSGLGYAACGPVKKTHRGGRL